MGSHETATFSIKNTVDPYIIEYPALMDTAQLSAARLHDIDGALEAATFSEVLEAHDPATQERIRMTVGASFDEALINFVTAAVIARRHQDIVIRAEASEGLAGYFPWEHQLLERVEVLAAQGITRSRQLRIERYAAETTYSVAA